MMGMEYTLNKSANDTKLSEGKFQSDMDRLKIK